MPSGSHFYHIFGDFIETQRNAHVHFALPYLLATHNTYCVQTAELFAPNIHQLFLFGLLTNEFKRYSKYDENATRIPATKLTTKLHCACKM